MQIHTINDLSNADAVNILTKGLNNIPEHDLAINYHPQCANNPANLFYILKNNRYKTGNYYILENNGNYIGSAGWNNYTDDIALILTRLYINKEYRTKNFISKYFLPKILEETQTYKKLWITCNDYNKSLYNAFVMLSEGRTVGHSYQWPEVFKIFKPIGSHVVNNVPQYVAEYERLK